MRSRWLRLRYGTVTSLSPTTVNHSKIFTGAAPFNFDPPTTVAVQILAGIRPKRPRHLGLTDGLWELNQRCWDQEPLLRPGMSEVICHLRDALNAKDRTEVPTKWEVVPNGRKKRAPPLSFPFRRISHDWGVHDVSQSAKWLGIGV